VAAGVQLATNDALPPARIDAGDATSVQMGADAVTVTVALARLLVPPAFVPLTV
jgi:hypothetical protein